MSRTVDEVDSNQRRVTERSRPDHVTVKFAAAGRLRSAGERRPLPAAGGARIIARVQPFSLYVHIPYCDSKCPYCDFNSYAAKRWPERALRRRADRRDARCARRRPAWRGRRGADDLLRRRHAVAVRAGDRSRRSARRGARAVAACATAIEITLEANPGTVDARQAARLRAPPASIASASACSRFSRDHLAQLGRIHSADEAIAAVAAARAAGFDNLNLDLMFAVPGQTRATSGKPICATRDRPAARPHLGVQPDLRRRAPPSAPGGAAARCSPRARGGRGGDVHAHARRARRARLRAVRDLELRAAGPRVRAQPQLLARRRLSRRRRRRAFVRAIGRRRAGAGATRRARRATSSASAATGTRARQRGDAVAEQARGEFVFLGLRCRDGFAGADFARALRHRSAAPRSRTSTASCATACSSESTAAGAHRARPAGRGLGLRDVPVKEGVRR